METRSHRRSGWGLLVIAILLLFVGGWYLLRNTFGLNLPELDSDAVWPVLLILLGVGMLLGFVSRRSEE